MSSSAPISRPRLLARSLVYHRRIQAAVALGVMAATAVLTGALLVGDSVRGSLRHLALDRLGDINDVLVTDRLFRRELAGELAKSADFTRHFDRAVPAMLVEGSFEKPGGQHPARAAQVSILGCDDLVALGPGGPKQPFARDEVVLNAPLATELDTQSGSEVILRIGQTELIPADSPLGSKTETIRNRRLKVREIVPAEGLGRFALRPTQLLPLVAFVSIDTLTTMLEKPGRANAIFVTGPAAPNPEADERLKAALRPTLGDYGFKLERTPLGVTQVTSERMLIEPAAERAFLRDLAPYPTQPVLTYLANTLAVGDREIPYSTVSALDFAVLPPLGPFNNRQGKPLEPLKDDEIALNTWAADDLQAQVGDVVELTYFEPESTHGRVRESKAHFRLAAIVDLAGAAADRDLTPQMPGVTDQLSIGDWDPPFPFDAARVRKKDEQYWDAYHTTPKAFVSLAAGRRLWASRFGRTTSIRADAGQTTPEALIEQLRLVPADFGFSFVPIRQLSLRAAEGTTPFGILFLGFSMFLIAAAMMLVALLFRLGVEQRASELGLLLAVGMRQRRVAALLAVEGLIVAALGALAGVAAGVGYAWLMLAGLRTWWLGAVTTPMLELYVGRPSLLIGYFSGVAVSLATILATLGRMRRLSVRRLLAGQATSEPGAPRHRRWPEWAALGLCLAAVLLGLIATRMGGEAQAGAFFGSGAMVLAALLLALVARLGGSGMVGSESFGMTTSARLPLVRLALRNASRNPGRSTLSIGLVAAASFLIVAISAFRLDPRAEGIGLTSGSGGYALAAQSAQAVYQDLNTAGGRADLGLSSKADQLLARTFSVALRVRAGEDASCLNLYQSIEPRVLGVPQALIDRGGFAWAASAATTPEERENPWLLLKKPLINVGGGTERVPVVLDLNTAMYSLHLWRGIGETYAIGDGRGGRLVLEVVGLLKNSIFQGDLLISESQLIKHFPDLSGYRYFLFDVADNDADNLRQSLEHDLGDYGFDVQPTLQRLASLLAVQNTYLSTFQSLGGLGLLLGTFGLATVQLRSVLERQGELALLEAVGFRRRRLARMVVIENGLLLLGGLAIGVLAALVAVLPHLLGWGNAAALPWRDLLATLTAVLVVGLVVGRIAVRAVLRTDLIQALRAE